MIRSIFLSRYRIAIAVMLAIVCLHSLQGCTALGLQQPKTFRDDYVYAITQITALRNTSTAALNARQINIKDMEYVIQLCDQSRAYLDTARQVYEAGETLAGKTKLELATGVLLELQKFLNSRAPLSARSPQ